MLAETISPDVLIPEVYRELFDPYPEKAYYGGRGGGKSMNFARVLLIQAAQEPLRIACCREVQESIKDSVKLQLEDEIEACGLGGHFEVTDKEIRGKRIDSLFVFRGLWRNPDGIRSLANFDRVWIEEAARASQRSLDLLIPTIQRKPGSEIWYSWNPEYEHDPVDKRFRGPNGAPAGALVRNVNWIDIAKLLSPDWIAKIDEAYRRDPDKAEHVYGGEYVKAVEGAYYASELRAARLDGRIGFVSSDPNFTYRAYWDLGHSDATAVVVAQCTHDRIRVLDYCEGVGQPPSYYMSWLRLGGYSQCECILPHDGASVHPDNPIAMSYEDQLRKAGFRTRVVANQGKGAARQRISVTQRLFPRIWFNEDTTRPLLKALGHYHEKRSEDNRNVGLGPEHDWSSHGADAFGLMCIDYEEPRARIEKPLVPKFGTMA